jgi:hypothetical protein
MPPTPLLLYMQLIPYSRMSSVNGARFCAQLYTYTVGSVQLLGVFQGLFTFRAVAVADTVTFDSDCRYQGPYSESLSASLSSYLLQL